MSTGEGHVADYYGKTPLERVLQAADLELGENEDTEIVRKAIAAARDVQPIIDQSGARHYSAHVVIVREDALKTLMDALAALEEKK